VSFITIEQRIAAGSQFTGTNGGSTGTITTVTGLQVLQGETFQLRSRAKDVFTFIFDFDATNPVAETATRRRVFVTTAMTAAQVRDAIIRAVNRTPGLALYASSGGASQVNLTNGQGGTAGNLAALPDTVVNAGFVVSAMAGGVNRSSEPVDIDGVRYFPEATFGGIFDFDFATKRLIDGAPVSGVPWRVERAVMQLTGAAPYTLSILYPDGTTATLQTGAGALVLITNPILLAPDERLHLLTVGAVAAMYARVTARPST